MRHQLVGAVVQCLHQCPTADDAVIVDGIHALHPRQHDCRVAGHQRHEHVRFVYVVHITEQGNLNQRIAVAVVGYRAGHRNGSPLHLHLSYLQRILRIQVRGGQPAFYRLLVQFFFPFGMDAQVTDGDGVAAGHPEVQSHGLPGSSPAKRFPVVLYIELLLFPFLLLEHFLCALGLLQCLY